MTGSKEKTAHVWAWKELGERQQAQVARNLISIAGGDFKQAMATLDVHCGAVMISDGKMQIILEKVVGEFDHPEQS